MLCKCGLCRHPVSVRLFVCLSVKFVYSVEMSKHILRLIDPTRHSSFPYGNILTGTSLTGASNAAGVGKNRDSRPISGYRIDDCWTCEQQLRQSTVQFIAQTTMATHQLILFLSQLAVWTWTTTTRREENLITARRVCIAQTNYAVARCPSVRHTPVLCVNGDTYPQSFFHRRVALPF